LSPVDLRRWTPDADVKPRRRWFWVFCGVKSLRYDIEFYIGSLATFFLLVIKKFNCRAIELLTSANLVEIWLWLAHIHVDRLLAHANYRQKLPLSKTVY
jgi:hypothetical protein